MKHCYFKALMTVSMFSGFSTASVAQNVIDSIISSVKQKSEYSQNSGKSTGEVASSIFSGLSTIFQNSKIATKERIVGKWVYKQPAVVFESSNLLKKAGGSFVSTTIEKKLNSVFAKYGIKPGKMVMTFDSNGNFTQTIAKKTIKGTYTIDGKNVKLTYAGGVQQLLGTTQIEGNSLLIVMDASKLLKFAGVVSSLSGNSTLKSLSSLFSSMDGMECGVRMEKSK